MIFTARKKTLCITFLLLAGLVLIGIGVTLQDFAHRIIPIVLGGGDRRRELCRDDRARRISEAAMGGVSDEPFCNRSAAVNPHI